MNLKDVVKMYWAYVGLGCLLIVGLPLLPLYFLGQVARLLLNRHKDYIMNPTK